MNWLDIGKSLFGKMCFCVRNPFQSTVLGVFLRNGSLHKPVKGILTFEMKYVTQISDGFPTDLWIVVWDGVAVWKLEASLGYVSSLVVCHLTFFF